MTDETDILIIGGGLVGASLAVALGQAGLNVTVVEACPLSVDQQPNYDERSIALAQGSQCIFSALGLWQSLQDEVCPIHTIHVSDRGHFGFTRLRREQQGVPALGYVATARVLGKTLLDRLGRLPNVRTLAPAQLIDFQVRADGVSTRLMLEDQTLECSTRLLVAADGAQSSVRDQLGIHSSRRDYGQTAVIANVTAARGHENVAYERFTDSGPLALLPMSGRRCALVWTVRSDQSDEVMGLDDAQFLSRLQERFGYRLGRFVKVGQRHAYPLQLLQSRESVRPRMALIGNAVHTLHPVAGQGFNLGLRDVAALAEVVMDARRKGQDIGDPAVLARYADWRQTDQRRVVAFTDGMVRLFGHSLPPVTWLRDAGMLALDICPPAKRWFGRLTMGRAGRLPRLARGLEL
ncbi:MAG: 2-octaprenyl-6-methoxyphenyl hydroxylase [Thiogranum sp.]